MTSTPRKFEHVGAVVIGRNEGERLIRALRAVVPQVRGVVYADSGSSDASPQRAAELGVRVVTIDTPYTAAKGRQAGLDELLRLAPDLELVQFIDGDCILREGWLAAACDLMARDDRVGAISGRRREEHPGATIYNAMIDVDWNATPGACDYPGGDSLCRVSALRQIGGWSQDLISGEDPDLGFRLRDAGWGVLRLGEEMTLHDINMRSFGAYWRRAVRAGYGFLEVGWRHRRRTGRWWLGRVRSAALYAVLLPVVLVAGCVAPWPLAWVASVLAALLYARLFWALWRRCRAMGVDGRVSAAYALANMACKGAVLQGAVRYVLAAARGRRVAIIEYKAVGAGGAAERTGP